jgi:hypothetical protein
MHSALVVMAALLLSVSQASLLCSQALSRDICVVSSDEFDQTCLWCLTNNTAAQPQCVSRAQFLSAGEEATNSCDSGDDTILTRAPEMSVSDLSRGSASEDYIVSDGEEKSEIFDQIFMTCPSV